MRIIPSREPARSLVRAALPIFLWALTGTMPQPALGQAGSPIAQAETQVVSYLKQLGDMHCREIVTQERIGANGHVESSLREEYDYLIMMSGNANEFQLNESRVAPPNSKQKLSALPMLVTNGMSTVLLVFHPYYRDGFNFEIGPEETMDGQQTVPIHFTHIPGRRSPIALALREREFPLDLKGTAWLDKTTGEVVKVEAGLERDMTDVGLHTLNLEVQYKPVTLSGRQSPLMMPSLAVVEVSTAKQHWRNTHSFDRYRSFSTDVQQDQNIKVRVENSSPDNNTVAQGASSNTGAKEKQ